MCYNTSASGAWVTNENPWGDYVGVWHMDESGGLDTKIYDATTNALDGVVKASGNNVTRYKNGVVGATRRIAVDKNHGWGIVVNATNGTQKTMADTLRTDFSASFWMNPQGTDVTYGFLIDRRKGEYNDPGGWGTRLHVSPQLQVYAGTEKPFKGNYDGTLSGGGYAVLYEQNTWSKVDVHWYATSETAGAADIYLNGAFVETVTLPQPPKQDNANIGIGGSTQDNPTNSSPTNEQKGRRFNGYMDEVRLRTGGRSADWVKADYDTVNDPDFVSLVPPDVLTVSWANSSGSTPGVSSVYLNAVTFGGNVLNQGSASSCAIVYKLWKGASEPENWTALTNGLVTADSFAVAVTGLEPDTAYNYKLYALNGAEETTEPISGTVSTLPPLAITWDNESGTEGLKLISYGHVIAAGSVFKIGGASSCDVQCKLWLVGETEPEDWTIIARDLNEGDGFAATIRETSSGVELTAGTSYNLALRVCGDDGEVAGKSVTFATKGEQGDVIGSDYTHFFDDGTNAVWVADDYERYLPFTVTGYTGTVTLTNFPVLVDVRAKDKNGFTYDDFYHYDGSDIAFVDEKGHIIPHEIDTWNKSGMSLFWVRLPEMTNGTTFTMCYRSPLLEMPPDPGNTFERYVGVWHMNEREDGVVNLKDSTVNNFETETHAKSTAYNNGQIGYARRVAQQAGSASSYGRIIAFDHDDILRTGVGNVFTFSGWYKLIETPPKWAYLVSRKSEDTDVGWGVQYGESSTTQLRVWSGSSGKRDFKLFDTTGAKARDWNYWTFVFDGSVNPDGSTNQFFHAFLNGEELQSTSTNGGLPLDYPVVNDERATYDHLCVVGQENGTGAFNGYVDEARYSKGMRSADWIKAEYDSMLQVNKPFVTKGNVSRGQDSLVPVVVWERGAGLPDTILDVSYAYVQFAGTVTYCGMGYDVCHVEYKLWVDGEVEPEGWTLLKQDGFHRGDSFSIPVTGLKQDMLYNFCIRAANESRQSHEHSGQFRTNGNLTLDDVEGELMRVGDRFVHRYRAGSYSFTTPDYVTNVEIMVVGGGGAGGYMVGGGGGGGGVFHSLSFPVTTSTVYRVHVGKGGIAASNLTERSESGEISYFALASDEGNPLVRMHGGGGGGSYINDETIAKGADGASGGGGTCGYGGGSQAMLGLPEEFRPFGNVGGRGNYYKDGGSIGKVAAGGGGGAGRAATGATFDTWSSGGSGGVGLGNSMTGEQLFYGAGGGGGYIYRMAFATDGTENFTKPGGGGSGIGGNAANVREGMAATSGVPNTGAGGGGGSSYGNDDGKAPNDDATYWQGGNGGDGVVLIAYEAHGRDPIAEEPRISMTSSDYISLEKKVNITYRAYWAGIQAQENDIYVLYSTVSEEDVASGNGEMVKVATDTIGIGNTTFIPPAVGYTYWVRLVARKDANSFMYSDEICSFEVPAVEVNGTDPKMPDENDPSKDYAQISYNLYDTAPDARLYCYWSEAREDLAGDAAPTGPSVFFLDLGTGRSSQSKFTINAADGLERNKTYYVRLATGNESGTKYFLSKQIVKLEMIDKPRVIFNDGEWVNHTAVVDFLLTTANLDPSEVELWAVYSGDKSLVEADPVETNLVAREGVVHANIGNCASFPDDLETGTQFPMWSPCDTNYYARLALATNGAVMCYSQRFHSLTAITHVSPNTLLVYVKAHGAIGCYGDTPPTPPFEIFEYGGLMEGPGWEHWQSGSEGSHLIGAPGCEADASSPVGKYDIVQGTLAFGEGGQTWKHDEEVIDPVSGDSQMQEVQYYYNLIFTGSKYIVTNAQFSVAIDNVSTTYTGEDFNVSDLDPTVTGLRNNQPITYLYRAGTNDWSDVIKSPSSNIWTQTVQFKASAPNHGDAYGTFTITVNPAPLYATISAEDLDYRGVPQQPVVTTNVEGHVKPELNPLTVEYRDAAGEWQGEVPSFTQPGEYKLYFRVSATNHVSYTTNCTFAVRGWDYKVNMDGKSGYPTQINVSDPGWLLRTTGETSAHFADRDARYANLDRVCTNGLKLWQNYVIDRADLSQKLVAAVRQRGARVNENSFVVYFPGVEALRNTGLRVGFRVDSKLRHRSDTAFRRGDVSDKYEMNIPLGPDDPTGLYVFNMVLTPTNSTPETAADIGESVLASVATVGVLRVSSSAVNTVTAAPWMAMSKDEEANEHISVGDAVNPKGISADDMIYSFDSATSNFNAWASAGDGSWKGLATCTTNGVTIVDAETSTFAPGNAFWLVRSDPDDYFYLIGRYTGGEYLVELAGGTEANPGWTLVANPTMSDVDLKDLVFVGDGPASGDLIVFQTASGLNMEYDYRNGQWGRVVSVKSGRRITSTWTPCGSVPAGTGFWYKRTAPSDLKIRFGGGN